MMKIEQSDLEIPTSRGALAKVRALDGFTDPIVLQVNSLTPKDDSKYRGVFSDGGDNINVLMASQLSDLVKQGALTPGATVRVNAYTANNVPGHGVCLMITDLEVLSAGNGVAVGPLPTTPADKAALRESNGTRHPAPSPSEQPGKLMKTPGGSVVPQMSPRSAPVQPSPPMTVSKRTAGFHRIGQLNPYDSDWVLKAKLDRKGPLRTTTGKGASVMSVELIDEEGKQIQGTFWRHQADRFASSLEEGKVYVFEKFQVRVANKQYSSVRNDYEIQFTDKTEVYEAPEQGIATTMTAAVDITPIENLPRFINRKVGVDILGVVTNVGSLGTVKRKSDNSEAARRDVTLVDKSGKSVVVTLWGENASGPLSDSLATGMVVQITNCRVSDFNGCSVASLSRSQVTLSPESQAGLELSDWWINEGSALEPVPVGAQLANARGSGPGSGGAGSNRDALHSLKEVKEQPVMEPEAKGTYHNAIVTISTINPDQTMYYLANPETGRKVVEQGGQYYSESDGKYCDQASYRYVLNAQAMDWSTSNSVYLNLFNEQAEAIMGVTADTLAELRTSDEDRYKDICKSAKWTDWAVTIQTRSREYQGERRLRHTVMDARPVDFLKDGLRLMELINRY